MSEATTFALLLTMVVLFNGASLLASAWIMREVVRGHRISGERVLTRQLWHLASADALQCGGNVVGSVLMVLWYDTDVEESVGFNVLWLTFFCDVPHFGATVSMVYETLIAAGFVGVYWRWRGVFTVLRHTTFMPWVLAVPVTLSLRLQQLYSDPPELFQVCGQSGSRRTVEVGWFGTAIFMVTFALYGLAAFRALWYPSNFHRRPNTMIWLFPLAFLVTFGPCVLPGVSRFDSMDCKLTSSLNGLVNCMVYAQNFKMSQPRNNAVSLQRANSINSRVSSSNQSFERWSTHYPPVGFALSREERPSRTVQREALRTSEMETSELEAQREALSRGSSCGSSSYFSIDS